MLGIIGVKDIVIIFLLLNLVQLINIVREYYLQRSLCIRSESIGRNIT